MFMTVENRKKLQIILEDALAGTIDDAPFDENTRKRFYKLVLSLIHELNARDIVLYSNDKSDTETDSLCTHIMYILENFSRFKVPVIFCTEDLERFAKLASSFQRLSMEINDLSLLLQREFANRASCAVSDDTVAQ